MNTKKNHVAGIPGQALVLILYLIIFPSFLFSQEQNGPDSPIGMAINENNFSDLYTLLKAGADPNGLYYVETGKTFLMEAAERSTSLTKLLLDYGADPELRDKQGQTAVYCTDKTEILRLLASRGARFDITDNNGISPLMYLMNYDLEKCIFILDWEEEHNPGFSAAYKNRKDYYTDLLTRYLNRSYYFDSEFLLAKRLLDGGANPAAIDDEGIPIIFGISTYASDHNSLISLFIERGAPVNAVDEEGNTLLIIASRYNDELVQYLLRHGADSNKQNNSGKTALMEADSEATISSLLAFGANPNLQDENGKTALMHHHYHLAYSRLLLLAGADPNLQDKNGETALMNLWDSELFWLLLQAGADPVIKDLKGRTALHHLASNQGSSIINELISRGCRFDESDIEGSSPLTEAAQSANDEIILLLLGKGADPNRKSAGGKSALYLYCMSPKNSDWDQHYWNPWEGEEKRLETMAAAFLAAGARPAEMDEEGHSALNYVLLLSMQFKDMESIRDLMLHYANEEEIKAATEAAKKIIREIRNRELSEKLQPAVTALIIFLLIAGLGILLREKVYAKNILENPMGTFNGLLTMWILFGGALLFIGVSITMAAYSGWNRLGGLIILGGGGGVVGLLAGTIIAFLPKVQKTFKKYRGLYYIPSVISGIIALIFIFRIWI